MKKTLFLLFCAGMATAQAATIYTTSTTSTTTAKGNYWGFASSLVASGIVESSATLPQTLSLDSVSLTSRADGGTTTFKIAVYQYTADGTVGEFLGLSTNSVTAAPNAGSLTLNFNNIQINSSATYQYLFVNENTIEADLNKTAGADNLAAYQGKAIQVGVTIVSNGNLPSGSGTYKGTALNTWEGNYLPKFTITTSPVPEAATASMGLLGLASLLMRRRRS